MMSSMAPPSNDVGVEAESRQGHNLSDEIARLVGHRLRLRPSTSLHLGEDITRVVSDRLESPDLSEEITQAISHRLVSRDFDNELARVFEDHHLLTKQSEVQELRDKIAEVVNPRVVYAFHEGEGEQAPADMKEKSHAPVAKRTDVNLIAQLVQNAGEKASGQMPWRISTRDLSRHTTKLLAQLQDEGRAAIITYHGVPSFVVLPIGQSDLFSLVLGAAPQLREDHEAARAELAAGKGTFFAEED